MIIGLGYEARAGKDFAADILCKEFGCQRLSFAQPLYAMAFASVGLDPLDSHDHEKREAFKTELHELKAPIADCPGPCAGAPQALINGRALLQWLGTNVIRAGFEDTWALILQDKIRKSPGANYVIPDCRFLNEAVALKDIAHECWVDVELVQISRASGLEGRGDTTGGISGHRSETEGRFIPWNRTIVNDFTENFREQVIALGKELLT